MQSSLIKKIVDLDQRDLVTKMKLILEGCVRKNDCSVDRLKKSLAPEIMQLCDNVKLKVSGSLHRKVDVQINEFVEDMINELSKEIPDEQADIVMEAKGHDSKGTKLLDVVDPESGTDGDLGEGDVKIGTDREIAGLIEKFSGFRTKKNLSQNNLSPGSDPDDDTTDESPNSGYQSLDSPNILSDCDQVRNGKTEIAMGAQSGRSTDAETSKTERTVVVKHVSFEQTPHKLPKNVWPPYRSEADVGSKMDDVSRLIREDLSDSGDDVSVTDEEDGKRSCGVQVNLHPGRNMVSCGVQVNGSGIDGIRRVSKTGCVCVCLCACVKMLKYYFYLIYQVGLECYILMRMFCYL